MEYNRLESQVEDLRKRFDDLQTDVRSSLRGLEKGEPPQPALAQELFSVHADFKAVREDILALHPETRDGSKLLRTLADLENVLDDIDPPYAELHKKACTILNRVLRITDTKKGAGPLRNAHSEARTLRSEIQDYTSGVHPAAESLTEGDHPLAKLYALVTEEERFSDENWQSVVDDVGEAYPDLTIPLLRGRLQVDPERTMKDHSSEQDAEDEVDSAEDDASALPSPGDIETEGPRDRAEPEGQREDPGTHPTDSQTATKGREDRPDVSEERDSGDTSVEANVDERSATVKDGEIQDGGDESADAVATDTKESPAAEGNDPSVEGLDDQPVEAPSANGDAPQGSEAQEAGSNKDAGTTRSATEPSTPTPETAGEAAEILLETPDDLDAQQVLIKHLLRNDLDGLAYCLAESLEAAGSASVLPPWLLRAFTLGPHLRTRNGQHGAIAHRLQFSQDAAAVLSNDGPIGYASWLLVFGAVLRPALHAPMTTSVSTLLDVLSPKAGLKPVAAYVNHIHDFVQHHRPADASIFGDVEQDSLAVHIRDLSEDIQQWDAHTDKRKASYAPATRTWHAQLREGPVACLREALTNRDTPVEKRVGIVEANIGDIEDPDYQKLYRDATGKPDSLEGKALSWIKGQFDEVRQLAERWLELAEKRLEMEKETDASSDHTKKLIENLLAQNEPTVGALDTFARENQHTLPGIAARRAAEVVKTLHGHLSGNDPFREVEPRVQDLLRADLLRIPDAPLERDLTEDDHADRVQSILKALRNGTPGWRQAFETYVERECFDRSRQLLDALQRADARVGDTEDVDSKKLEERHQDEVHRSRGRVRRRTESVQHKIEHAFQLGYLDHNDRADLLEQQRQAEEAIEQELDLGHLHEQVNEIEEVITERKEASVAKARQRFESEEVQQVLENVDDAAQERIQKALGDSDVYTAHAYIDRLLNNQSLPEEKQKRTALDTFFPGRMRAIRQKYEHNADAVHSLTQRLEKGEDTEWGEQLSFADLTPPARKETANVLQRWQRIQQQEKATEEDLEVVLGALGFEVTGVDITPFGTSATGAHGGRRWAEVTMVPPSTRSCPIPAFGSKTGGNYRFLLSHGSPTVEEIAAGINLMSVDGKADIAFYFGMLDEEDRRELAALCQEREADFLVIDAALFLFALTYPRPRRLRALFECALPFTYAQPYSEVGSRVPPEMFFGREREIKKILDPNGPSLVYGGRQLGKTVLLRQAKREFHDPPHRIASWIDLRTQGVDSEETDKVWPIIVDDLLNHGVFEEGSVHRNMNPQKVGQRIQEWLEEDSTRRILLLLDEADSFFEHEHTDFGEKDFPETRRLKGVMEATNGRLKVVFAGLHNVFRATNSSNQPLGHLTDPICVGPLLDDGEWQAARDLIERPLSALGYEFESDDLITFILSLTNYYPSLIQLYCRYLLEEMLDTSGLGAGREGPPHLIKKTDIRESYGQTDLMRQIQERFLWTLQLDARYEVLAYAIGYAIKDASSHASESTGADGTPERVESEDGFSVEWAKQQALKWWQDGFRGSSSKEDIEVLLDEMVGLGVLRKTNENSNRYTLRSPNVLPLLGSQEEMLETLDKERVVQPEFDPKTHRRIYHSRKLAPLTRHQYELLTQPSNRVNIVWGTRASGINEIVAFLREAGSKGTVRVIDSACSAHDFEAALKESKEDRESDAVTLAVVDVSTPWGEEWIHRGVEQVNRLRSKHRYFRIVFLADADRTWSMCDKTLPMEQDGERAITTLQLQPWHDAALHTWFLEREQSLTAREMRKIGRITGNWPILLKEMEEAMDGDPSRWDAALDTVRRRLNDPSEIGNYLDAFGLTDDIRRNVLSVLANLDDGNSPPDQGYRMSLGTDEDAASSTGHSTDETSEFVELMHGAPIAAKTDAVLEWARRTGSASLVGSDRWRIDPLVGKLLQTADS